jgi:hypothetical protein
MKKYSLSSIIDFFKTPETTKGEFKSISHKYKMLFKLFFIYLLIVALISIITGFLRINFNVSFKEINQELVVIWILNLSIIPILEEIAYRLPLFYNKKNLVLSFTAIVYFLLSVIFADGLLDISTSIYLRIVASFMVGGLFYTILTVKNFENRISKFWEVHYRIVFYVLLLLFALGHIERYNINLTVFLLMPMLLLPQFIGGIFFSFTRIKFGITYSIVLHIAINAMAFIPQIILYYAS